MKKRNLFCSLFCSLLFFAPLHAQDSDAALYVTPSNIQITRPTVVYYQGAGDGFDVVTKNSEQVLASGSDLIWGAFYQSQPNNPGIFSLTSAYSPAGWNPCFTVRANGRTGIMNSNPSVALEIGSSSSLQQVKVNGSIVWGSDARMKSNIKDLSNSLGLLKQMRGVSYNLKEDEKEQVIPEKFLNDPSIDTEKVNLERARNTKQANLLLARNFYGFLAQDVKELFPDLVFEDDSTGLLSVDYIGLIPVLVDGLKEQQSQIEQLQSRLDAQNEQIVSILKTLRSGKSIDTFSEALESAPLLYQNTPNPFSQSTTISFYIPNDIQVANLYIYDIHGLQKKSVLITDRESASFLLSGASLEAGTYFYTLVCDGQPVDTKQMILTK